MKFARAAGQICKKLYNGSLSGRLTRFMDDTNLALWGMIVVPLGVAICFGPALLVWLRDELRAGADEKQNRDSQD